MHFLNLHISHVWGATLRDSKVTTEYVCAADANDDVDDDHDDHDDDDYHQCLSGSAINMLVQCTMG